MGKLIYRAINKPGYAPSGSSVRPQTISRPAVAMDGFLPRIMRCLLLDNDDIDIA
jgi:hypothetical protein